VKLKTATALVVSSLTLFVASLAVAQQQPTAPTLPIAPRGLPRALPVPVPAPVPAGGGGQAGGTSPVVVQPAAPAGAGAPTRERPPSGLSSRPPAAAGGATPATTPAAPPGARVPAPSSITQVTGGTGLREFEAGIDYQPLPPGARITFNLQDADLPDLIRAIGNITGKRFIIGSKVRSIKTTIYSPTKVTPAEAYSAFLSVLETNGMTVVPSGRYLKVEESAGAATSPLPTYTPGEATPADDRFVTRIHRLRNIAADDAATVLGHFKSRDGDLTPYAATNTLIITDTGSNIRRMMQILAEIDVPAVGEQIWVERVHYAPATELAQRITELLGQQAGGGGAGGRGGGAAAAGGETRLTRILADERSNSLIIVATERMYLRVLELIRRLDVPVEGEGEVHVYYLQHADSEELANTLNQITGGGRQGGGGGGQAGQRGAQAVFEGPIRITADKRTNALVITSTPRDYASVRHVIGELDRARRQVFIEAVVMELDVNNTTKLGVSWHGGAQPSTDTLALGGFRAINSILFPGGTASQEALQGLAVGIRGPTISGSQNLLGIPGLTLGIPSFGAVITALTTSGDGDVLATPSIIATDNSPADINVGSNIPLQTNIGGGLGGLPGTTGQAGTTGALPFLGGLTTGFAAPRQDVGTKIRVVPHINDSNEIRLEIDEEISEAGAPLEGSLGAIPINKRTAKTTVVVQDQQTVVIGGLIRNAIRRGTSRIPILGDLPLIGILFRSESRTVERRNLLLFLTPYVIRDQSDLRRIFERKMRERQEFLDRYFVFSESQEYRPPIDYTRTNGLVEEIRQSIRELRVQAEIESRAIPRPPPPHTVSPPIELPAEARGSAEVSAGRPADVAPPPEGARGLPIAVPVTPGPAVTVQPSAPPPPQ
jgi:general secretion pathway protein D